MLVVLGDSISGARRAWPQHVPCETVNLAVVGARIADLSDQLDQAPDAPMAVVSIGTNDVIAPGAPLNTAAVPPLAGRLLGRYERVVVLPVLGRPNHGGPYTAEFERRRTCVQRALQDAGLPFLGFTLRPWEWHHDAIHPNRFGRRHIAREVRRWISTSASRVELAE